MKNLFPLLSYRNLRSTAVSYAPEFPAAKRYGRWLVFLTILVPSVLGTVNAETVPHRFLQHLERVAVEVYISSDLLDSASLKAAIEVEAEELVEKKVGLRTPSEEDVVLFIRVRSFPMERSATDKKILAVRAECG